MILNLRVTKLFDLFKTLYGAKYESFVKIHVRHHKTFKPLFYKNTARFWQNRVQKLVAMYNMFTRIEEQLVKKKIFQEYHYYS